MLGFAETCLMPLFFSSVLMALMSQNGSMTIWPFRGPGRAPILHATTHRKFIDGAHSWWPYRQSTEMHNVDAFMRYRKDCPWATTECK